MSRCSIGQLSNGSTRQYRSNKIHNKIQWNKHKVYHLHEVKLAQVHLHAQNHTVSLSSCIFFSSDITTDMRTSLPTLNNFPVIATVIYILAFINLLNNETARLNLYEWVIIFVFSLYPNEIDIAKTSDILKGMLKLHASLHITHLWQVDDTSTTSRCWDEGNKDFNWRSTQKLWVASCFLSITCAVCHNQKWCLIGKRATSFR